MLTTEWGISIDDKLVHPTNAVAPMLVTELGITVFIQPVNSVFEAVSIMPLQLSRES